MLVYQHKHFYYCYYEMSTGAASKDPLIVTKQAIAQNESINMRNGQSVDTGSCSMFLNNKSCFIKKRTFFMSTGVVQICTPLAITTGVATS
jgi:hypothetical protein